MPIAAFNSLNNQSSIQFTSNLDEGEEFPHSESDGSASPALVNSSEVLARWEYGDGSLPEMSDNPSHTMESGGDKRVAITFEKYANINEIDLRDSGIVGELDVSRLNNCYQIIISKNENLTTLKLPANPEVDINYLALHTNAQLQGDLDLSRLTPGTGIRGFLNIYNSPSLNSITLNNTTDLVLYNLRLDGCELDETTFDYPNIKVDFDIRIWNNNFTTFTLHPDTVAKNWSLQYNNFTTLDLSPYGFHNDYDVRFRDCPNLISITFPSTDARCAYIIGQNSNLTGTLDLSPLSGLGNSIQLYNNPNLEEIKFPTSLSSLASTVAIFWIQNLNALTSLTNLDKMTNLGGQIRLQNNYSLTSIDFPVTNNEIIGLYMYGTPINGNLDLSGLTNIRSSLALWNMSDGVNTLTSIDFPLSSGEIDNISCYGTSDLTGVIDLSGLTFSGILNFTNQANLSGITLPTTIVGSFTHIYLANTFKLGYTDIFTKIQGVSDGIDIRLQAMGMSSAEVNHTLVDLDNTGWINGIIDIRIVGSPADGTSGGFDGLSAITNLTSKGWTITV